MTARSILKSYFLTGKKPTQGQFAALIDSFLHLSEDSLSISQITNLANALAGKASTAQIDALVQALMAKLSNKTSYTVTLLPTDTFISINWDATKITAHGTEPFDIQLYEVATDGTMQKSTALLQVNAAKTIYSFYVGENSNLNFYYKII